MDKIAVEELDQQNFRVTVQGRVTTTHEVHVEAEVAARLAPDKAVSELVHKSFEFLLEREPNTSILRRFDLTVISQYFPDYEHTIRAAFGD
jgi:hypothetical protein